MRKLKHWKNRSLGQIGPMTYPRARARQVQCCTVTHNALLPILRTLVMRIQKQNEIESRQQGFVRDFQSKDICCSGCDTFSESLLHIFMKKSVIRCYGLSVCDPQCSYVKMLMLNTIVLGAGTFGNCLSYEGRAPRTGISVFIKQTPGSSHAPSTMWRHSEQEPGRGLSPECNHTGSLVLDFQPQNCETNFCCLYATQPVVFC